MLSLPVSDVLERRKLIAAPPDTTVAEAARLMKEGRVGAILVVERERLVGIFTERDALFRVVAAGLEPATVCLREVMTADPATVAPDETFGYALLLMYERGFRHVPVVEGGKAIGVVSARHALDPDLEEFAAASRSDKYLRDGCVILGLGGFAARASRSRAGPPLLGRRLVRVAPPAVDTLLLASAIWLTFLVHQYPFVQGWLTAKVIGLVVYI